MVEPSESPISPGAIRRTLEAASVKASGWVASDQCVQIRVIQPGKATSTATTASSTSPCSTSSVLAKRQAARSPTLSSSDMKVGRQRAPGFPADQEGLKITPSKAVT